MPSILPIDDGMRAAMNEMRKLSTDALGNEIFVGLNVEQSVWMVEWNHDFLAGKRRRDRDERDKYLVFQEKHDMARHAVLGAEIQMRNDTPTKH